MKANPHAEAAIPAVPWRHTPLVFLLLVFAILAVTWPWALSFATATLDHWDPPFHAWKLELVARTILSGHLLPPDGDTNMYYPHSSTLYFEALHWPQAVVAATLFGLTSCNPLLVYHLVLVGFWALSGLCFWMLLQALGASRRAALLGALLFTLLPYRISYMVEFNMQLCFGLPLFFFFLVRFFQHPSIRYACGMALAWWLQAASELYQAVFLLLVLPFPALALLAGRWRLLGSFRRFWLPAAGAAALGGTLTFLLLGPYLTMLDLHEVNRNLQEIATHILEPFSYLRPGGWFHFLPFLDVRRDEMIVYPTLAVMALAAVYLALDARRLWRLPVPRWVWAARALHWLALVLFLALSFRIYSAGASAGLAALYAALPVVAVLASLAVLVHPTERDIASVFATSLFAAAVFAYFMSLGPVLSIRHAPFTAANPLYLWVYKQFPALQGFRVVSRFSIYVLIYLVTAAALAWSAIERRWLRRPAWRWLWLVPLALAVLESYPHKPFRLRPLAVPYATPVLEYLDRLDQPYVLAMAPMGERAHDSRHMLQIARTDRLSVYAWGGAYPRYTRQVRDALDPRAPKPAEVARLLRQLWPECFLLEDKPFARAPLPEMLQTPALRTWQPCNYAEVFAGETELVAEDERFALLRFRQGAEASVEKIRLVRQDYLAANPALSFRARIPAGAAPATLWLDINGYVAGRWEIGPEYSDFQAVLPACYILPLLPNRLRFHATGDAPFHLDSFQLGPAPAAAPPPFEKALAATGLPWLGHIEDVPAQAIPLDIRYPNGFEILACEPLETAALIGGAVRLRVYVRCPRNLKVAVNSHVRARLQGPDGRWIEEGLSLADTDDLQDIRCQLHPGIYALDLAVPIPARLGPGEYRLSLLLRDHRDRRVAGRQNGVRGKLFPVPIPVRIQAPAGP